MLSYVQLSGVSTFTRALYFVIIAVTCIFTIKTGKTVILLAATVVKSGISILAVLALWHA